MAKDGIPGGPVIDLSAQSREDDRVALDWSPPLDANGAIVKYVIVRELVSESERVASNRILRETEQAFITLTGLSSNATYNVTVLAVHNEAVIRSSVYKRGYYINGTSFSAVSHARHDEEQACNEELASVCRKQEEKDRRRLLVFAADHRQVRAHATNRTPRLLLVRSA